MTANTPSLSPQELLEHSAFLVHLARGLTGDAEGARDVVQEAYVAALERPPREGGSLRGWLAIVTSNLARNARRGESRRAARQRAVARSERQPAPDVPLEHLEIQRALIGLLMELSEEKRTVLYLRYYEALTPAAIAARLGVSRETVKTRQARALAELRTRLDERSGGDRREWLAALAPLLRSPLPPLASSGILLTGKGLLAAGLALGLGLLTWVALERRPPAPAQGSGPALVASAAETRAGESRVSSRTEIASPTEDRARTCALEGRVLGREDGRPVSNAEVEVRFRAALESGTRAVTSDEQGRFRLEWDEPVTVTSVSVRATALTCSAEERTLRRLDPGQATDVELLVGAGASLAGTVVDEQERPVPGARVRAWLQRDFDPSLPAQRETEAGPDGSFRLEHLGTVFTLAAEAADLACLYGLRGELEEGAEAHGLRVVMAPAVTFNGHVVDLTGRAVEGARLTVEAHRSSSDRDATPLIGVARFLAVDLQAISDATGAFRLGPAPRRTWNAGVSHPGHLHRSVELDPLRTDQRVELDPGSTMSGLVTDSSGAHLAGARVRLDDQGGWSGRSSTTDAAGRFALVGLCATDNGFLLVSAAGQAVQARQPVRVAPGQAPLQIVLTPEHPLAGRVVDPQGRPVAGAALSIVGERLLEYEHVDFGRPTTWEWAAGLDRTRTDEQGRFRFEGLYAGEFELRVVPLDATELALRTRVRSGREDLELVLDPASAEGLVFTGRVLDALTGRPVESFDLSLMQPSASGRRGSLRHVEDAEGRFRVAGLDPGNYELVFQAPGYAQRKVPPLDYGLGEVHNELLLVPACSVQLRVSGASRNASLEFLNLDGQPIWPQVGPGSYSSQVDVGPEPLSVVLPRQPLQLIARHPECLDAVLELDLTEPPTEPIVIDLQPDPREELREWALGAYLCEDEALPDASDTGALREALGDGRLHLPTTPVEIEFLEQDGRRAGTGTLQPLGGTRYAWRVTIGDESQQGEDEGPGLNGLELPGRITRVRLRCAGRLPCELPLESHPELGPVVFALLVPER